LVVVEHKCIHVRMHVTTPALDPSPPPTHAHARTPTPTPTSSGGIPLLLPFACLTFFVTFWVDKILLLRMYNKPPQYDHVLALTVTRLLPVALMVHLAVSTWMYGNQGVLQSGSVDSAGFINKGEGGRE